MIISEAELRVFLGLQDRMTAVEHAILQTAHSRAEGMVINRLGYNPEQSVNIEYYPRRDPAGGTGLRTSDVFDGTWDSDGVQAHQSFSRRQPSTLQLSRVPVRSVTELFVDRGAYFGQVNRSTFDASFDDSFQLVSSAGTLQTLGTDYYLDLERPSLCSSGCIYHRGVWPVEPGSVAVRYIAGYSHAELSGRADQDAADADAAIGVFTDPHVNAAGISHAIQIMAVKFMHQQQAFRKTPDKGFDGGDVFEAETFQDYSYKRPSSTAGAGAIQLLNLGIGLLPEAEEALEPFIHYGRQRL